MKCAVCNMDIPEGETQCSICGAKVTNIDGTVIPATSDTAVPGTIKISVTEGDSSASVNNPAGKTSVLSIISLATGILSFIAIPLLGAVAAIITGYIALSEIKKSGGVLAGRNYAKIGLILGYISLTLVFFLVLMLFLSAF